MNDLKKGDQISMEGGGTSTILEKLGEGGQGTVYKVSLNEQEYALKWYEAYKLKYRDAFRDNLRQNIFDGPPSSSFLWPIQLTENYTENFGYLMPIRPNGFVDFSKILNKKINFKNLHAAVLCGLNIVDCFRELHRQGKSYQDLNDGNFFVNTDTGDVLICDNDNIAPDKINLGIGGKPGYMAPEIVRGDARPSTLTDQHSLAVVLFKLLMRHDPLMGRAFVASVCITEETEKHLYGDNPVFIFDPNDRSNVPLPGVHPNPIRLWPLYPIYIQKAFIQSFCEGMKNPASRLTDNEWRTNLIRLRGEILTCPCEYEIFASSIQSREQKTFICPKCKTQHSYPLVLDSKRMPVFLFPGNKLYKCHTEEDSDDYKKEQGRIVQNKKDRSIWGIKNLSETSWSYSGNGVDQIISPGGVARIQTGVKINFHHVSAAIINAQQ